MFALSFNKFFTAICLLGGVVAHPLEGALEERNTGSATSVASSRISTVISGGGGSSVSCPTVTYLPGPTTTIVASSVTITSYTSGSSFTVTSYIPHPTATVVIGSSHVSVTTAPVATQYTTTVDGTATAIQTTIIATVTAGDGPASSCACEPTVTASRSTFSRNTFSPTETVYQSSVVVSTSFAAQATTVTAA